MNFLLHKFGPVGEKISVISVSEGNIVSNSVRELLEM